MAPESGRVEGGGLLRRYFRCRHDGEVGIAEIWEKSVLRAPGARDRVDEIARELRVAAGVTRHGEGDDHA
jgi:hypothetical protein